MKKIVLTISLIFTQCSLANTYSCIFEKKVDSISFIDSSEIKNSPLEENQKILKIIDGIVTLKQYKNKIKQTVKVDGMISIIDYKIVKKNSSAIMAISKKNNFVLFFQYNELKLVFSEFYDAQHVANYFYTCKKFK